jgi:predicted metal-binding membrane protein
MIAAIMLPSAFPLFDAFRRMTLAHPPAHADCVLIRLRAGVGAVRPRRAWVRYALHGPSERSPLLLTQGWLIGAAIVAIAGVYQFGSLKHRCLDKCCSLLMRITGHWRRLSARRGSFLLGVNHGAFCIGCCWALTLLPMFAVGTGSVGWMLALGQGDRQAARRRVDCVVGVDRRAERAHWAERRFAAETAGSSYPRGG